MADIAIDSSQILNFPRVSSDSGTIKPEYMNSYNRNLNRADIEDIIRLCHLEKYQDIVDGYTVRKIIADSDILVRLMQAVVATENIELIEFICDMLSYDDQAQALWSLNIVPNNESTKAYLRRRIDEFAGDYEEEFVRVKELLMRE